MKNVAKIALVAFAIVVAVETWARLRAPRGSVAEAGTAAPDFTLPDAQGRDVTLSKLRGRVVAVNFWATWCPPCKAEIPEFAAIYAERADKCLEFLGVAEDSGTRDEVVAAAQALGINYPVLLDSQDGQVAERFQVPGYPKTFLVDARGNVRRVFEGAVARTTLEQALAPLLAETKGTCPRPL